MYYYRLFVTCAIVLFSLFGTCLPTMKAQEKMVYVTHDDSTTQQKKALYLFVLFVVLVLWIPTISNLITITTLQCYKTPLHSTNILWGW